MSSMDGIKTARNNHYIVWFHFKTKRSVVTDHFAEREGFEPPVPFQVRLISSQVH